MRLPISNFRWQIDPTQRAEQIRNPQSAIRNPPAFSLVEILIVVGLLSVIILGLMAMFGQTQRAFRTGMTQTDVLEAGRMATDLIVRELEQVTPSRETTVNFYACVPYRAGVYTPLQQPLPGGSIQRMNLIQDLFFLTRRNQEWVGIGYFVRTNSPATGTLDVSPVGLGTLYRFETNVPALSGRTLYQMFTEFDRAQKNDSWVSKIAEGVIHFKVRAFDTNGIWITNNILSPSPRSNAPPPVCARDVSLSNVVLYCSGLNIYATNVYYTPASLRGEIELCEFWSNAVPASVELEIGILEDRAWERFKSLPDAASQNRYITNQAGRVHLFRQRIPIRNVDPLAYQ